MFSYIFCSPVIFWYIYRDTLINISERSIVYWGRSVIWVNSIINHCKLFTEPRVRTHSIPTILFPKLWYFVNPSPNLNICDHPTEICTHPIPFRKILCQSLSCVHLPIIHFYYSTKLQGVDPDRQNNLKITKLNNVKL